MNWVIATTLWALIQTGPFPGEPAAKATVLLFVSTDCPISNRYAPEVKRLHAKFASRGIAFWLVYANAAESDEAIQDHVKAFGFPGRVLRDPGHALVRLAGVSVTPEAAVFGSDRQIVYRGRIDDRYVDFGVDRAAATRHDLDEALSAVLAGKPVPEPETKAIGCFLADFPQ
jgi:hypothetical protein